MDSDYEYLSITVTNDIPTTSPVTCSFNEIRTSPLINNMEDYNLQVVNFTVPSSSIPLFTYVGNTGGVLNIRNTSVSPPVDYTGTVTLTNLNQPMGAPQTIENNNRPGYGVTYGFSIYNVFFVQQFLSAMNYCISLLMTQFKTDNPSYSSLQNPYFIYNEVTGLFGLVCDRSFNPLETSVAYNGLQISSNDFIHRLLTGIPIYYDPQTNLSYRKFVYQVFNTYNNITTTPYFTSPDFGYIMYTQSSPINYWISCKRIYITSNRLRINPESITTNTNALFGGSPLTKNIIADFNLNTINTLTDFYTPITYTQFNDKQNSVNITGQGSIYEVDLQMYYSDNLGNSYPILLGINESFTVKFKFYKYK